MFLSLEGLFKKIISIYYNKEKIKIKKFQKFQKEYASLIITLKNKPLLNNREIFYLTSIDDIIDIALQNNKNIFHYEVIKNKHHLFYLILDNYLYLYNFYLN